MTRRFDILVLDLDGTLLSPAGAVSPRNIEAVRAARDAGLEIIIATGRALVESQAALQIIEHDGLVIAAGGSILCEASTGRTIHRSAMPRELVSDVTTVLLRYGHKVLLLKDRCAAGYDYLAIGPGELDPASRWWFESLPVAVRFVHTHEDDPHPQETVRAGAVASEDELAPIARQLQEDLGDRAFLQHWSAVTESQSTGAATHLLEVFNPRVSKWSMVEAICRDRDLPGARVIAIGDGLNDVELIREAGLGIAMGNADPRVRAVADRVTEGYEADGVARAIDRLLAGLW